MNDLPTRLRNDAEKASRLAARWRILGAHQEMVDLTDRASLMRDAADEIERLRQGVQDMLDGNYPHPRTYRPKPCPHGAEYWHECPSCNDAALQAILTPEAAPASSPIVKTEEGS